MSCPATTDEPNQLTIEPGSAERPTGEQRPAPASPSRSLYYGWVMLPLAIVTLVASSPGQTFGISIFNESIRVSLGLTHGQLATAYMLGTLLGALPITFIGRQMDRHGLRRTLLAVVTLFSLACFVTSLVQNWLTLTIAFAMLRMLGPGALALLSGNTLAFWFERRLGTVEGMRQLGMAAAMTCIPALNLYLVYLCGWRGAFAVLGIAIWILLFPAYLFLFRNRPSDVGQPFEGKRSEDQADAVITSEAAGLTLKQTLQTRSFWIVSSNSALFSLIHTAIFFCLVPIFAERGLDESTAAATLTGFAVALAVMQMVGGMLADRIPAPAQMATGLAGLSLAMLLFSSATTVAGGVVAGTVLGATQGLFFASLHPLWARYFGRRHLGRIRGVLMTMNVSSSSLGPLLASLIYGSTGSFTPALVLFAILPLPMALLSLWATRPDWRTDGSVVVSQPAVQSA